MPKCPNSIIRQEPGYERLTDQEISQMGGLCLQGIGNAEHESGRHKNYYGDLSCDRVGYCILAELRGQ